MSIFAQFIANKYFCSREEKSKEHLLEKAMQCSLISRALRSKTVKVQPASLDELCEQFKTIEGRTATVQQFRDSLPNGTLGRAPLFVGNTNLNADKTAGNVDKAASIVDCLPLVLPAYQMVRLRGKQAKSALLPIDTSKSYNAVYQGLAMLQVSGVGDDSVMQRLKDEAMTLPSTVLAIKGSSGRSLKIIVAGKYSDGSLPKDSEDVERFHYTLSEQARKLYGALLSLELDSKPCTPLDVMRWTYDPELRYRSDATPLLISHLECYGGRHHYTQNTSETAQPSTQSLQEFLSTRYSLRFNELTNCVEYMPSHSSTLHYLPIDSRVMNTMLLEANEAGLEAKERDLRRYLGSTRIQDYNAARDYLWAHKGDWDGVTDHISELARRVPTSNKHWPQWFHTWFLGMVAQWLCLDRKFINATMPLLIGPKGCGKTAFGQLLLPPELRMEGFREIVVFSNKADAKRALTSSLLISLNEFDKTGEKMQQSILKSFMHTTSLSGQQSYSPTQMELPRRASCIATSTFTDILHTPSFSRCYLAAIIEGSDKIDLSHPIPYGALYAQAYHELKAGHPYCFTSEEMAALEAYNTTQTYTPPEVLHFTKMYRTVTSITDRTQRLTLAQIIRNVSNHTKYDYDESARRRLARYLANEARQLRVRRAITSGYPVYYLERKSEV